VYICEEYCMLLNFAALNLSVFIYETLQQTVQVSNTTACVEY